MPCERWPPCGERQAHDRVAGLEQRVVDGGVGLRAGVRLDVGVLAAEQRLRALDRERLDHVDVLAAAVVALAGVALGVLVGATEPWHSRIACGTKFSEAIISSVRCWRSSSS